MTIRICPNPVTLENFLLGKLPEADQSALSDHFEHCTRCAQLAGSFSLQDELTEAIRSRKNLAGEEAAIMAVVEKGKLLSSQLQTAEFDQTIVAQKPSLTPTQVGTVDVIDSADHDEVCLNFLAPAEHSDELGRLGGYRVLELLGMGGMGMVFRAEDERLKRQVALKVMKPSIAVSRGAKNRFLKEAQFTAAIEHDNIVPIFQVGEDYGVPFIAMPFLKGESLKTRVERQGRLSQLNVVRLGIQIASGLAAAHERSLIHRDIKPDNIWIEEKTGRVRILDFGLGRVTSEDAGLTQSGFVMGTPRYMAPEQALSQDVDHRCDLFSLGSVLYHLVSGQLPFHGGNLTATLVAVVQRTPRSLESIVPGLDPDLCQIISRLMSKDRDQRPRSASEVVRSLQALLQKLKAAEQMSPPSGHTENADEISEESLDGVRSPSMPEPAGRVPAERNTKVSEALPESLPTKSSLPPGSFPLRRWLAAAGAGGFLLALLGIIVITIRDKEGRDTVIRVPEGAEIDVKATPGSKVMIRRELEVDSIPQPGPVIDQDRRVAELLTRIKATLYLAQGDESIRLADGQALPDGPFTLVNIDQLTLGMDDSNVGVLSGLQSLDGLCLYRSKVTAKGLAQLNDLPKLRILNCHGIALTEADLAALKRFPQLSMIFLLESGIKDSTLVALKELPRLEKISLESTEISDEGLLILAQMPKLRNVILTSTKVTEAGVQKLAAALPHCSIEYDRGLIAPQIK